MTEKISKLDETLRKLSENTETGRDEIAEEMDDLNYLSSSDLAGDVNCPYCHGLGYLRRDLPLGHPDFGRLQICSCRQGQVSQQIHQRLFSISNLENLQHLTFENFQPRGRIGLGPWQADSLERAYNQAQQFSQKADGWLLLQGGYGCGKTHLAAAIANFTVSLSVPTLFITVPDLLDALRFTYSSEESTFEQRFDEIRQASLLIMDDFGTQNATAWAQEKLFQILNYRYINKRPLVVTTNLLLEQIEGRIRSRLEDPELVTRVFIQAPDYRRPTDDTTHSDLSSLAMHSEQTFSNWDDRQSENLSAEFCESLANALKAATSYSREPRGWLVFTGPYACGKTHLAAAIANSRADLGQPPLFISVSDLLDHLRATFSTNSPVSLDRRFEEMRSAPLLILDALGEQSPTAWANEKLFQLIDYRHINKLPTVITTAKYLNEIDERILSRILDARLCTVYAIKAPGYRGGVSVKVTRHRKRSK
ncbi:MAG: DNA replication protein DnaC [Anaerolineales bacterium]|nr:AAA family ATPase [Anaerolineae bacterium]PWB55743.1 MAG: DNA replication protein DnaC [Anaerolineales bacterium]